MTINLSHDKNYLQCGVIMSDNIFINHLNHIHGNFLTDLLVKITLMNNFAGPTTRRHEECYSQNMELGVLECNLTK